MWTRTLLPLLFLAVGCDPAEPLTNLNPTTNTDPTQGSGAGTTASTETLPEPSTAVDGSWVVVERTLTLDECGMAEWLSEQELGTVEVTGDWIDGFDVVHSRGLERCTEKEDALDDFRCDRRQDEDTRVQDDYGIDALLLLDIWTTGSMVMDETFTMTTEILTDCEGSGCWLAALETGWFPCHSTVVVTAEPL